MNDTLDVNMSSQTANLSNENEGCLCTQLDTYYKASGDSSSYSRKLNYFIVFRNSFIS